MNRFTLGLLVLATLACGSHFATSVQAQPVTGFYPSPQVVGYVPVQSGFLFRRTTLRPVYAATPVTAGYAPAATACCGTGVTTGYAPTACCGTGVTSGYAPATTAYYAPQTTAYYAPQTTAYYAPQTTAYYGSQVTSGAASYQGSAGPIVSGRMTTRYTPAQATTTYYAPAATVAPATVPYYTPPATGACCSQ